MHLSFDEAIRTKDEQGGGGRTLLSCSHSSFSPSSPQYSSMGPSDIWIIEKIWDLIFCVKNQFSVLNTVGDKLLESSNREPRHTFRGNQTMEEVV